MRRGQGQVAFVRNEKQDGEQTGENGNAHLSPPLHVKLKLTFPQQNLVRRQLSCQGSKSQLTSRQINYRMRVTLNDGRQMTGQMLAFDKVSFPRSHEHNPPPLSANSVY